MNNAEKVDGGHRILIQKHAWVILDKCVPHRFHGFWSKLWADVLPKSPAEGLPLRRLARLVWTWLPRAAWHDLQGRFWRGTYQGLCADAHSELRRLRL